MTEEHDAEALVTAQRERGERAGRAWAAGQPGPVDRRSICEVADRRWPTTMSDFIAAHNLSGGFIDGAEAYFAEQVADAQAPAEERPADWHRGDWMQTHTGIAFYPLSPRPEDVNPLDIAHSLAMQCRYNGHVNRFYSVAEHCVLMSDWIIEESGILGGDEQAREFALWALLHDAAEAYIGDMVRPLKLHMPHFRQADDDVTAVIADRFGLVSRTIPPEVKAVDTRILLDERAALLGTPPGEWTMEGMQPLGVEIRAWSPERAKREYLIRLAELRPA